MIFLCWYQQNGVYLLLKIMWLLQIWKWKDLSWSVIWTVTSDALLKKCFVQKGKFGGKKASCHEKNTLNRENSGKMLPQVRKSRHSQWPMPGEFSWGSVQQGLRHTATRRTSVWKDPMHVSSSLLTPLSSSLKINECLIAVYTRVSYLFFFFRPRNWPSLRWKDLNHALAITWFTIFIITRYILLV